MLCFLAALFAGFFTQAHAKAEGPAAALKTTPLVVPAAVLGIANPVVVRAAMPTPTARRFELSKQIRHMADRVDTLARHGLYLNQRSTGPEKLHLRFESRLSGGLVQLCYRH